MKKVVGLWSGHDTSFAVFEDGRIKMHSELERHTRLKEDVGNVFEFWKHHDASWSDEADLVSCFPTGKIKSYNDTGREITFYGHHLAHAAHAYYSSKSEHAMVFTFDGGGLEADNEAAATTCTVSIGKGLDLHVIKVFPINIVNIGGVWTRLTKYVFGYESGWPQGHQAGTVMALAALGDPTKYKQLFIDLLSKDMARALFTPVGHVRGMSAKDPARPRHPFLGELEDLAKDDQTRYDLAAGLQAATEDNIRSIMQQAFDRFGPAPDVCFAGGVCLNSLAMGKVKQWFPHVRNSYIPPCPYDAGLSLGAAQYHMHHVLRMDRPDYGYCFPPYLGESYSEDQVKVAIVSADPPSPSRKQLFDIKRADNATIIKALDAGKIVSVFNGRAESGRRALGNRSIMADPRKATTKDLVNEKVKHRQWFRPFAPSCLLEDMHIWFDDPQDSPYMSFVSKFNEKGRKELPAVVHFDGTGRVQTVTPDSNPWYAQFLKEWREFSGTSVMLNTSFNDKEPICETPEHAIACFLKTEIDCLYFPEHDIVLEKT